MSVYTILTATQLEHFFSHYALGHVTNFKGIQEGVDNTNYDVTTTQGKFIVTIFESLPANELNHILNLLHYLGDNKLQCPYPIIDKQHQLLGGINGKPAAIFHWIPGTIVFNPSHQHCHEIGLHLGRLHQLTQNYSFPLVSKNDWQWCKCIFDRISAKLSNIEKLIMIEELNFQELNSSHSLPRGVIHGDLFRDNALFIEMQMSGMLDFYSASTGTLLLDVAIAANDWCINNLGLMDYEKLNTLLLAYEKVRPLESDEKHHLPILLRGAALRFWLSRLERQLFPRSASLVSNKDPLVFRKLLEQHQKYFEHLI